MFSIILAMDISNLVGDSNGRYGLPWHYSEDMQFYKKMTSYKKNVMGRKTFELIGRPLPNRETYIVTRDAAYKHEGCTTLNDIEEILALNTNDEEIMIIGGVEIFKLTFPYVERIYLTRVLKQYTGDCYYNELDLKDFDLISRENGIDKDLVFEVYERKN